MQTCLGMSEAQQGTVHSVHEGLRKFPWRGCLPSEERREGDSEACRNNKDNLQKEAGILSSACSLAVCS